MRLKCLPFGSNSKLVLHLNTMASLKVADYVGWLVLDANNMYGYASTCEISSKNLELSPPSF